MKITLLILTLFLTLNVVGQNIRDYVKEKPYSRGILTMQEMDIDSLPIPECGRANVGFSNYDMIERYCDGSYSDSGALMRAREYKITKHKAHLYDSLQKAQELKIKEGKESAEWWKRQLELEEKLGKPTIKNNIHKHLEDKQAPTLSNGQVKCLSCAEWYYPTRAEKKARLKENWKAWEDSVDEYSEQIKGGISSNSSKKSTALGTTIIKEYSFIIWQDLSETWKEWERECRNDSQFKGMYGEIQMLLNEVHLYSNSQGKMYYHRNPNNFQAFIEFALRRKP